VIVNPVCFHVNKRITEVLQNKETDSMYLCGLYSAFHLIHIQILLVPA
jgi:hypothetical protein